MADELIDKIKKLEEEVERLRNENSKKERELSAEKESRFRSELIEAEKLKQYLDNKKKTYEDVDKKIESIKEKSSDIVDYEQILKELQEERLDLLKQEFQTNQKALLQVIEQMKEQKKLKEQGGEIGKQAEEELKKLEKKYEILKDITHEQGSQIQKAEKEKELKEKILSIAKETWELSKQYGSELEKHIIHISKATGGFADYNSALREAGRLSQAATLGTGITGEENLRALEALSDNFKSLTLYSKESISSMQVATAQLNKLGVDAATAAKGFDTLVNAMGKTPQQAVKIQESFVQMASKNRLAFSEVTKAFEQNKDRFVGYGDQMMKVMDGLAEQALKTGVQINSLINIAQGFDTFEDASRKVGSLNALLGGDYFNSIEMLTASDEERIKLLKEGVNASGMQWESLNRQQKQAIASAAGIRDLNEAAKMFGETSLQNTKQQREQAEVQKTLAEQAESVSLGMDKLKSTLNGLFIAIEPFVSLLMSVAGAIGWVAQKMNYLFSGFGEFPKIGAILTSSIFFMLYSFTRLGGAIRMIGSVVGGVVSKLFSFGSSLIKTGAQTQTASGGIANAIRTIGMAGMQASFGLLAIGAALFMIGAGIGLAALGFSKLVESFAKLTSEQAAKALGSIIVIMTGFTIAIGLLAIVAIKASAPIAILSSALFAVGIAVALIGAGIGLMSAGIASLVDSFATLFATIKGIKSEDIKNVFSSIFSELTIENILVLNEFSSSLDSVVESLSSLIKLGDQLGRFISLMNQLGDVSANINTNLNQTSSQNSSAKFTVLNTQTNEMLGKAENALSTELIPAAKATAAEKTATSPLIPAQQTTTFVPMIVNIDKTKIIEILKEDIAKIAASETNYIVDAIGITQSGFFIQNRVRTQQGNP